MAKNHHHDGNDVRSFTGAPSIREKLHRKYNAAIDNDAPINPLLDELLFDPDEDESYYELPLLKKTAKKAPLLDATKERPLGGFRPVDSMPPTKHQDHFGRCMGGYDGGFETGLMGDWDERKFQKLVSLFESNKTSGECQNIVVGGEEFELKPHGGGQGVHYKYIIEGRGLKIYFHHMPDCGIQPIRFRLGFEALHGRNLFEVHEEVIQFLNKIGFNVDRKLEKISRLDGQCMFNRPVSDFVRPVAHEHVVMRARNGEVHLSNRVPTSFNFGSDIRIRTYDKKRQLLETCDEFGLQMIAQYSCGGVIPDHLTRVEFQITRDALNEFEINTIEDLKACEADLFDWLTYDWFRIIDGPRKKGHTRQQEISEVWQEVRAAFAKYFPGGDNNRPISRKSKDLKGLNCKEDSLIKQFAGCVATAYSRSKGGVRDFNNVLKYVSDCMVELKDDIVDKIQKRSTRFRILTGCKPAENSSTDDSLDPRFACGNIVERDLLLEGH